MKVLAHARFNVGLTVVLGLTLALMLPLGFQAGAVTGHALAAWTGLPGTDAPLAGSMAVAIVGLVASLIVYLLYANRREALSRALDELERARDVLEEEVARRALVESESRLRAIADLAPTMVWSTAVDGSVDYLNRQWFEFTGAKATEGEPLNWEAFVHPDDLESVLAAQARVAAGQAAGDVEFRLRNRSGDYRTVLSRVTASLEDEGGRVTRLMGTLTDIQDLVDSREATTAALAEAKARKAHLRLILDSVPDAMVVTDDTGGIQSFSTAAETMFQWKADEIVGQNVRVLMPEPYRSGHDHYMSRHVATGEAHLLAGRVLTGLRRDGSTFPFEMSLGSLRSDGRRYFTSFMRDLSERRAAEQRLQALQTELAHVSRLSAMGEMAAGMAHELNQPLMAAASYIQGSSRLLQRMDRASPDVVEAMGDASREVLRAGEIIRRIRGFVAQGVAARRPEDVEPMLREAVALALIGAKDSGISIRYQIERGLPAAMIDRVQVQQVVVNLARNAAEAMARSPRREMTVSASLQAEGIVEVSVADTGSGLDAKARSELFHPFVTTKPSGMGLGLSISRTIVEAQGGRIWSRPRAGGGTIFCFTIPAVENGTNTDA